MFTEENNCQFSFYSVYIWPQCDHVNTRFQYAEITFFFNSRGNGDILQKIGQEKRKKKA